VPEAGREGERFVKSKLGLGMLTVIGLLALSATGAQAGAGGTPSVLTSFFVCNSISGDDAAQSVDVDSSAWGFNPKNVRIGNATLACAFAKLFSAGTEINPNPGGLFQQLKCYSISVQRQAGSSAPPSYTVTDVLLGVDPDVHGSSIQYICAPASFLRN
jgi:hypothetical protein